MNGTIILVGAFHEAVELCESAGLQIVGLFDAVKTGTYRGYPILGSDEDAKLLSPRFREHPVLLTPDLPIVRQRLAHHYLDWGYTFQNVISPAAFISPSARIGVGVMIQSGVHVSSDVKLGNHVRLNTCSNVMHDAVIEDFVTIAPNAVLLGHVIVEAAAYVGANATVLPSLRVGASAVIGAGAVVTRDVPQGLTVAGCPARPLT